MRQRNPGQSFSEYGIVLALVGVVSIAALNLLAPAIGGLANGGAEGVTVTIVPGIGVTGSNGANTQVLPPNLDSDGNANGNGTGSGDTSQNPNSPDSNGPVTYTINGRTFTVPPAPPMPANTSGGNGSEYTASFNQWLEQVADQLQAAGMDEDTLSRIRLLASHGWTLSANEQEMEFGCTTGKDCTNGTAADYRTAVSNSATDFNNHLNVLRQDPAIRALPPELVSYIDQNAVQVLQIAQRYDPMWSPGGPGSGETSEHSCNIQTAGGGQCPGG